MVYFTRTPRKREEDGVVEEEEEEEECQTPCQGCEVILSLVESSVFVDRPFYEFSYATGGV